MSPFPVRVAITGVYAQGLRLREVAQAAEVTEEAVKKRVQRGRQQLADCLRRAGVFS